MGRTAGPPSQTWVSGATRPWWWTSRVPVSPRRDHRRTGGEWPAGSSSSRMPTTSSRSGKECSLSSRAGRGELPDPVEVRTDSDQILALERRALDRWGKGDPGGFLELYAADITYFDPATE